MTLVNLTGLETMLGGPGVLQSGEASATYWAGNAPFVQVAGAEVIFPTQIRSRITDGAPVDVLDMVPTRGVSCVRWLIRSFTSGAFLERFTEIPDVPSVEFGALARVDPATFAPADQTPTLAETIHQQIAEWVAANPVDPAQIDTAVTGYLDANLPASIQAALEGVLSSGGSVHTGVGVPPAFITGAKVGDIYIDTTSGVIYQLEEG